MSDLIFNQNPILDNVAPVVTGLFAGMTKINGVGGSKRLLISDRRDLSYVISSHSNADGTWVCKGLPYDSGANYILTVFDDTGEFNAEVADHLAMYQDGV